MRLCLHIGFARDKTVGVLHLILTLLYILRGMYYVQMIYHVNLNMVAHPPLGTPSQESSRSVQPLRQLDDPPVYRRLPGHKPSPITPFLIIPRGSAKRLESYRGGVAIVLST